MFRPFDLAISGQASEKRSLQLDLRLVRFHRLEADFDLQACYGANEQSIARHQVRSTGDTVFEGARFLPSGGDVWNMPSHTRPIARSQKVRERW